MYRETYDGIYQAAVSSPVMKKYHDLGTAENILPLNKLKGLPTRNLREATFDGAESVSGQYLAENYLGRRVACAHCPVGCIHLATLREPSEHEAYFYKTSMISYDYEPIYALGTMLGISDVPGLLKLLDAVEVHGLDAMSTGVALAWATEALEGGLISTRETDGLDLAWGQYAPYVSACERIVAQPNEFYRALARGVDEAAKRYGGEDFALALSGNEMPGYHTGPAAHIGILAGARHSHLDNAGYSLDQKAHAEGKTLAPQDIADALIREERWRQVLSNLVVCFFARGIYTPAVVCQGLRSAGFDCAEDEIIEIGVRTLSAKYAFKVREGFSMENVRIPKRIFQTPGLGQIVSESVMRQALIHYAEAMVSPAE